MNYYLRHSLKLLIRYQQPFFYPILIGVLILMPVFIGVNEKFYTFIFLFNLVLIFWVYSPYYLGQFSYSPEDARSLILFEIPFKDLIIIRNLLNLIMLFIPVILNLLLSFYVYPFTDQTKDGLIILSFFSLLPTIAIGNYLTGSSIRWNTGYNMSWKSVFVVLSVFFTDFLVKITFLLFSTLVISIIIIVLFLVYLIIYYLSFQRIVRTLSIYFCSIAEN